MEEKKRLRERMRRIRRAHVESLPSATRALLFRRPPAPVAALVAEGATVGLYHATAYEAPTGGYVDWFSGQGHAIALPWFADRDAPMEFRVWNGVLAAEGLVAGPHGAQPAADGPCAEPQVVFVPLLAFTRDGRRLGQGGGHYDRWLAGHRNSLAFGLAWDCQLVENLPDEPHDAGLQAIVTPTRIWQTGA